MGGEGHYVRQKSQGLITQFQCHYKGRYTLDIFARDIAILR